MIDPHKIVLVKTCYACPEQYDAYYNNEIVAYLRLRHGIFTVECPDVGGEVVYSSTPLGDGIFDIDERDFYISEAIKAIVDYMDNNISN